MLCVAAPFLAVFCGLTRTKHLPNMRPDSPLRVVAIEAVHADPVGLAVAKELCRQG